MCRHSWYQVDESVTVDNLISRIFSPTSRVTLLFMYSLFWSCVRLFLKAYALCFLIPERLSTVGANFMLNASLGVSRTAFPLNLVAKRQKRYIIGEGGDGKMEKQKRKDEREKGECKRDNRTQETPVA